MLYSLLAFFLNKNKEQFFSEKFNQILFVHAAVAILFSYNFINIYILLVLPSLVKEPKTTPAKPPIFCQIFSPKIEDFFRQLGTF